MELYEEEFSQELSCRARSLRSAKRNLSTTDPISLKKRTKVISPSSLELRTITKMSTNQDQGVHVHARAASTETINPKRKKKLFKGFVKKRRAPKKIKPHARVINAVVLTSLDDQTYDQTVTPVYDQSRIIKAQDGTLAQEETPSSSQAHNSPSKTRVVMPKLDAYVNGASSKNSSRHQNFNLSDAGHIQAIKATLHLSMVPETMMCRDAEQSKVFEFCKDNLLRQQPGSLYICGCPGTGKSLLVEKVKMLACKWSEEGQVQAPDICSFNCTSLTHPSDIFERILRHVSPEQVRKETRSGTPVGLSKLKHALSKSKDGSTRRMLLLIVDEIDYLLNKDQAVLHELFELPAYVDSRCLLIGISNAIDLADRCFQSFGTRSYRPIVIPFSPYTKDQLIAVLNQRLKVLPYTVFHPTALELCARKVAAASGDMRKALHVCRIALELLELEAKTGAGEKAAQNGRHTGDEPGTQEQHLVQIHHMAQALAKTFRSAAVDTVKALPKHQQMVLCAAVRLFRQKKKDATIGQLNMRYIEFCKSTGMPALSVPEFSSVCRVLADQGLLNVGTSPREERSQRVTLQVGEDDIVFALQATRFFGNYLVT